MVAALQCVVPGTKEPDAGLAWDVVRRCVAAAGVVARVARGDHRARRVLRGVSFLNDDVLLRRAFKDSCEPDRSDATIGFRVAGDP